ncbi:lysophospholipid acyltransferase family protein [Risungbinella massiliensis]|uniref:lysophospholipid acyltransferase family protein n=1 Tax=Risungbinella massiliensis TaxID=1329796 RepID=UPI0005CC39D3|nr:lysophospholipid acyltransferase family protein [Risungbinella massiliensis]
MIYRLVRDSFKYFLLLFYRFEVIGSEHVPTDKRAVVCCNHINNFDPPLVGGAIKREIYFMAKEELFRMPIIGKVMPHLCAFPVKRDGSDTQAIRRSIQILKEEKLMGIFPEGTRSKTGELGKFHTGFVLIASKGKAPIIPTAIVGEYRLFRKMKVVFGEPLELDSYLNESGKMDSEGIRKVTDEVIKRIQQLKDQHR